MKGGEIGRVGGGTECGWRVRCGWQEWGGFKGTEAVRCFNGRRWQPRRAGKGEGAQWVR